MRPEDVGHVAAGVLAGLGAAHARGVVHRDIKPDNVLLGSDGIVKVADFGVADLEPEQQNATLVGLPPAPGRLEAAGTLAFMSPEQAAGRPATPASDLYAIGAMLFLILAGRPHLDLTGCDELTARQRIATMKRPSRATLAALPAAWRPVVATALAPDATDRFPSAGAFAAALPPP